MTKRSSSVVLAVLALLTIPSASEAGRAVRSYSVSEVTAARVDGAGRAGSAGDVNGDGHRDILVTDCSANEGAGSVAVVFGPFEDERLSIDNLGSRGISIHGSEPGDLACFGAEAGDVNGDGLGDVLVAAPEAGSGARDPCGIVYVVFGKTNSSPVDLAAFDQDRQGTQGFRIDGPEVSAQAGQSFDGIGDVNGDGLSDVAIAAPFAGAVYVVFGKADPLPVDLMTFDLGQQMGRGYRILTGAPNRSTGLNVGGAGDVNGDDIPDVIVGYIPKLSARGSAYVVFGKTDSSDVDAHGLGGSGFEIRGARPRSSFGDGVTTAGDVNGDGLSDVIVTAPYRYCCGIGKVYVVFGRMTPRPVKVTELGKRGYVIRGVKEDDGVGLAVDGAGDINEDGKPDILVGSNGASFRNRESGAVYIVYGKRSSSKIALSRLGRHGYRIDGVRSSGFLGSSLSGAGDVTSDGVPDILSTICRDGCLARGIGYVFAGKADG